jgi:tRNA (mo5U34)-methyltransferase
MQAYDLLPEVNAQEVKLDSPAVTCSAALDTRTAATIEQVFRSLAPWRKGPFQIFDTFVDTEWRSNKKWERLAPHLDLVNKLVLDVGCGNGYYGWRMLALGAHCIVGLDPSLLYVMQHALIRRCLGWSYPNYVLPAGDTVLPDNLRIFDTVFSMGVLYHRKSPIEHLQALGHALKPGGEVVLETLVIQGGEGEVPSCGLLHQMMRKCGFREIETLDVTATSVEEQRSTEWMTFESLPQFLDPKNPALTVEGYPAPLRAIVRGVRT